MGEGGGVEPMLNKAQLRMSAREWNIASASCYTDYECEYKQTRALP